jgi:hypothetical protein
MNPATAFVLCALLAVAACSSGSSGGGSGPLGCSSTGRCPNDMAPSAMQVMQCNEGQMDPTCGPKAVALATCQASQPPDCGDAGVTQLAPACQQQDSDYTTCILNEVVDAGSGSGG